jgi:hypothetical protein
LLASTDASKPDEKSPWYQFSVRSLLLLTVFAAVLCTIGVHMHWLLSAFLATIVLVGGIAGRIVAGINRGFVWGVVGAVYSFLFSLFVALLLIAVFPEVIFRASERFCSAFYETAMLGGSVFGGSTVRPRSKQ